MSVISQNRDAQHKKSVLLTVDENFFPNALFLANQIATANVNRNFDICIASAVPLPEHPLIEALNLRVSVFSNPF